MKDWIARSVGIILIVIFSGAMFLGLNNAAEDREELQDTINILRAQVEALGGNPGDRLVLVCTDSDDDTAYTCEPLGLSEG